MIFSKNKCLTPCCTSYKQIGICDVTRINIYGNKLDNLNWSELCIPETVLIPENTPDIEDIDSVSATIEIKSAKLVETPFSKKIYKVALLSSDGNPIYENGIIKECPCSKAFQIQANQEGTCLTGRKLVITGVINQKIVYTANVSSQSVHVIKCSHLFHSYIILYPKFTNTSKLSDDITAIDPSDPTKTVKISAYLYTEDVDIEVDMYEEFSVTSCIEDIFAKLLNDRTIFKSITFFIYALPTCS